MQGRASAGHFGGCGRSVSCLEELLGNRRHCLREREILPNLDGFLSMPKRQKAPGVAEDTHCVLRAGLKDFWALVHTTQQHHHHQEGVCSWLFQACYIIPSHFPCRPHRGGDGCVSPVSDCRALWLASSFFEWCLLAEQSYSLSNSYGHGRFWRTCFFTGNFVLMGMIQRTGGMEIRPCLLLALSQMARAVLSSHLLLSSDNACIPAGSRCRNQHPLTSPSNSTDVVPLLFMLTFLCERALWVNLEDYRTWCTDCRNSY